MTSPSTTDSTRDAPAAGGYADVNGLHMYYERHGTGSPIVLLHGGLGSGTVDPRRGAHR